MNIFFDKEYVKDIYKPRNTMPEDTIYLTEKPLSDGSLTYSIYIGKKHRFICIDEKQASTVFDTLKQEFKNGMTIY